MFETLIFLACSHQNIPKGTLVKITQIRGSQQKTENQLVKMEWRGSTQKKWARRKPTGDSLRSSALEVEVNRIREEVDWFNLRKYSAIITSQLLMFGFYLGTGGWPTSRSVQAGLISGLCSRNNPNDTERTIWDAKE